MCACVSVLTLIKCAITSACPLWRCAFPLICAAFSKSEPDSSDEEGAYRSSDDSPVKQPVRSAPIEHDMEEDITPMPLFAKEARRVEFKDDEEEPRRLEFKDEDDEAMDVDEVKVDSESDSDWARSAPSKKTKRRSGKKVRRKGVRCCSDSPDCVFSAFG